jgi:hypothetical protein
MGFTADDLFGALTVCTGAEADDLADTLAILRGSQPAFTATLLSAWQADGQKLSPALRYELDAERARVDFYRALDAKVTAQVPGLTSVKGLEICDLYPGGLARHQNDLDFVAADETDLWHATQVLLDDGWELHTATFSIFAGELHIMNSVRRPADDPYEIPYGVELTTYFSQGNFGAIGPLLQMPAAWRSPAVKNILMLLYERYEQKFRARDLLDTVLLHSALRPGELEVLHDAVRTLNLGVEYGELITLVGKTSLGTLPPWPGMRATTTATAGLRLARAASSYLRPICGLGRQLQRRLITGEMTGSERVLWEAVQRQLKVPAALSAGLMAFGLPIEGVTPDVTSTVLRRRGDLAWADTPAARFLLAIGDDVTAEDFDELRRCP